MLLGRTRHCNYLRNCLCSRRTIHLGSCHRRILRSNRAQGLQAGDWAVQLLAGDWVARLLEQTSAPVPVAPVVPVAPTSAPVAPVAPVAKARTTQQP